MYIKPVHETPTALKSKCDDCGRAAYCLPRELSPSAMAKLENFMIHSRTLRRNEYLHHPGEQFNSLLIIRSGTIKTYAINNQDQVVMLDIYLPTEILGIGAIARGYYNEYAVAAETTSYCALPYDKLIRASAEDPELQHAMARLTSAEVNREMASRMLILSHKGSRARIAAYLLQLADRYRHIGFPWHEYYMPFTRGELGNHLGLTLETTSRALHELQSNGYIKLKKRYIRLLDINALTDITGNDNKTDAMTENWHQKQCANQ